MAENFNIQAPSLDEVLKSGGLDPSNPGMTYVNFANLMAQNAARQKTQSQQVAEASERIKQLQLESRQKQAVEEAGINPELKDYLSKDEAVALLKVNGVKQEHIDEFIKDMGDKEYISRAAIQAVILKKGGSGSLSLVGAKEGQPMQDENGKWVRTWIKRTPDLGILMTDRVSPIGVAVFQAEDPTGYEAGHTMLSIQDPKLTATLKTAGARATLAEQKVIQNKINNWLTLEKRVNPNSAAGQNALGLSGKANQRADRAFGLLAVPATTWEDMHAIVTDTAGILTGGVPQMPTIEDQNIGKSILERWSKLASFVTGHRTEGMVPLKYRQQLFDRIKEIKNVDNEIIDKQLGIAEVAAEDIIKQDPQRWERLKNAIMATTESREQDAAQSAIYGVEAKPESPMPTAGHEDKKAALRKKLGI